MTFPRADYQPARRLIPTMRVVVESFLGLVGIFLVVGAAYSQTVSGTEGSSGGGSLTCSAGQVVNGASCTATPTLGASGTLGSVTMGNATSGLLTLEPTTGALGTNTIYLPVPSSSPDIVALLGTAQTFSAAKTFNNATYSALFTGGPVGVGISTPAVALDVEAPSSIGNTGTNSTLVRFYAGSSGTPITAITPTFAISRYEALPSGSNTEGGQNGAIYASSIGNNTSSTGNSAQVNVITAVGSQIGSGDVVGFFGSAEQSGTPLGTSHSFAAFGIFTVAYVTSNANNQGYGANFVIANSTGTDCPLTSSAFGGYGCGTAGILLQAIGTNLSSVGVELLSTGQQFDTGFFIQSGAVKTTGFFDLSSDITSIEIAGSHTYGINLASGTYSTASIAAPGFTVDGSGNTKVNSLSTNGTYEINNHVAWSATLPTIASGFCTSPSAPDGNGTASFVFTVGSSCATGTGTLTMPAANAGWICNFVDVSNPNAYVISEISESATTVGISAYSRTTGVGVVFGSNDYILGACTAF